MRLAIIGAGNVGTVLGTGWREAGHDVRFGVREPKAAKHAALPRGSVMTSAEAIDGADFIVIATPWSETEKAVRGLGNLAGCKLIDCTNPLEMGPGGLRLAIGHTMSGAEQVAAWAQSAAVFKTFNQTGAENMAKAKTFNPRALMFVAGDEPRGKQQVMQLVEALGFEAIDGGPLHNARLLEPLAMVWIDQVMRGASRDFAFALVRRSDS